MDILKRERDRRMRLTEAFIFITLTVCFVFRWTSYFVSFQEIRKVNSMKHSSMNQEWRQIIKIEGKNDFKWKKWHRKCQLTDRRVSYERFFVLKHCIDRQFLTILCCNDRDWRLLIGRNRWHLFDHLRKWPDLQELFLPRKFEIIFTLISVSSWCARVNELYSIFLMTPFSTKANKICRTSSSDQP